MITGSGTGGCQPHGNACHCLQRRAAEGHGCPLQLDRRLRNTGTQTNERARQEKQKIKFERRQEAKVNRTNSPRPPGEDPDIAGIVPGPQPPREDMLMDDDVVEVGDVDEVNEA